MEVGPGDVIADRRLVSLLGSGGEGDVWCATRPDGTSCALKLVRPAVLPAPEEVRRRGAWLVRIDHPALVQVSRGGRFTAGDLAGWGFVEMDLVEGPSLQSVGPIPDALERLAPIAEALDLLHAGAWSEGVPLIHRDVKPGNLIASRDGLVLVDPSTMRGLDTRDLTRVGTPAYVAPEVHSGHFGPLADVYSLAATAAALLTGRRGGSLVPVLRDPWAHDLPRAVCAALDPDPAARPLRCTDLTDPRPVTADPPTPVRGEQDLATRLVPPLRHDPPERLIGGPRWALVALTAVTVIPATVWAARQTQPSLIDATLVRSVLIGAVAAHLLTHVLTRRAALGLFAPPWAWSELLSGRQAYGDPRATWLADVIAGLILVAVGGVALAVTSQAAAVVPLVVVVTLALIGTARRLVHVRRRSAWTLVWMIGLIPRILGGLPRLVVTGGG
ncbi:protein kinase domain-containing protein [Euzebya tangerina]|uniref:protein kinase domain-containing protein n=1 Tax=Euzebya tangerina TaxID=591198 RepID=UPI000E32243C|nr:hypothetical protein [Euzebya tangerina]